MQRSQILLFLAIVVAVAALIAVSEYQRTHKAPVVKVYTYKYEYSL